MSEGLPSFAPALAAELAQVWLLPWGTDAAAFREGWLAGRQADGAELCAFARGSIQWAAWHAARTFNQELDPK